jgi:glycosyltransferase involved in cell wall biosynthesis
VGKAEAFYPPKAKSQNQSSPDFYFFDELVFALEVFVKKILHVVHSLPVAGTELLVIKLIESMKSFFDFGVCCLDEKGKMGSYLETQNIPVFVVGRQPGKDWRAALKLWRLFQNFSPDIVHAHQYTPFFYSALAKTKKSKLIFTEHGRHYPDRVSFKRKLFNQWAQFRADHINAVCEFSKQRLISKEGIYFKKIHVLPNGVATENVDYGNPAQLKKELGIPSSAKVIGFVGRLQRVKNPLLLLEAFASLAAKYPQLYLLYLGEGDLRETVQSRIDQLQLTQRVRLLGSCFPVHPYLKVMDLFVLPSLSEGASVTLLEAMAAKVPVVVSAVGGNLEFVQDPLTGRAFSSENKEALAKILNDFVEKPETFLKSAQNAFGRVQTEWNEKKMLQEYKKLYETVI